MLHAVEIVKCFLLSISFRLPKSFLHECITYSKKTGSHPIHKKIYNRWYFRQSSLHRLKIFYERMHPDNPWWRQRGVQRLVRSRYAQLHLAVSLNVHLKSVFFGSIADHVVYEPENHNDRNALPCPCSILLIFSDFTEKVGRNPSVSLDCVPSVMSSAPVFPTATGSPKLLPTLPMVQGFGPHASRRRPESIGPGAASRNGWSSSSASTGRRRLTGDRRKSTRSRSSNAPAGRPPSTDYCHHPAFATKATGEGIRGPARRQGHASAHARWNLARALQRPRPGFHAV